MRRGSNKTRWAKFCCREYQAEAIQDGINALRDRAVNWNQPDLTGADLVKIFIPPDLQELVVEAYKKLDVIPLRHLTYSTHNGLLLSINCHKELFASPKKTPRGPNDCSELVKLTEWASWRFERGMEWGTVKAVWRGLQKACHREGTNQLGMVRYLWPSVMTLLEAGDEQETADKLKNARPPDWVPALPPALREAMKVTAGTIAGTMLLPREPSNPPRPAVSVALLSADRVQPVDLGWGEMVRPI
jgi:hypothetical protein